LRLPPPFQGGGTGSNPVGGAQEIPRKPSDYKGFRATASARE
jgi:hypothetical protein